MEAWTITQGSSFLATLGWGTESLRDSGSTQSPAAPWNVVLVAGLGYAKGRMKIPPFLSSFSAVLFGVLIAGSAGTAAAQAPGSTSVWHEYTRTNFSIGGHFCFITSPKTPAPNRPWIWRTSFPDFHADVDLELLSRGWHVGFIDCVDMLGCDASLDLMDQFYDHMTKSAGLDARPALEAVSRGGLHAYRYAARRPARIACIYADTPVMDLRSWPRQWPGAKNEWAQALKLYGFASEEEAMAYKGNPVDLMPAIAAAKIPLRHVISLTDRVVPPEQNTLEAQRRLRKLAWDMDIVRVKEGTKESDGHHFPLPEVGASAFFIMSNSSSSPFRRR